MADASVTPSQVLKSTVISGTVNQFTAGEAHNAGAILYQTNAANGWWFRANTINALSAGNQGGLAFSLSGASGAGQPVTLLQSGQITLGTAALVTGAQYSLSVNTGNIGSVKDRLTGEFPSYVGQAINTTDLRIAPGGAAPASVALTTNA